MFITFSSDISTSVRFFIFLFSVYRRKCLGTYDKSSNEENLGTLITNLFNLHWVLQMEVNFKTATITDFD